MKVKARMPILGSILDDLAKFLLQLGYSPITIRRHARAMRIIDRRLRRQRCDKITKMSHASLQACIPQKGKAKGKIAVSSTIKLLTQYLDDHGILLPLAPLSLTPIEEKLTTYQNYLKDVRGLAPSTIHLQLAIALEFIMRFEARGGLLYLQKLTSQDVEDFLCEAGNRVGRAYLKKIYSYLRSFLRFLALYGAIPSGVNTAIEAPRVYQGEQLPRTLIWETVQALLKSIDCSTAIGKRDYSMLLLIATYGLRASEVVDLKLDDIDWRANCLRIFQRKTAHSVTLPLTPAVGKSIIAYLRHGRPPGCFREIFVRHHAPHGVLKPTAVTEVFQSRSRRSGLPIPFQGVHCLRHSYAVHMLRQGISIKTIGDILGHQNFESTFVYLRLAVEDLRTVPLNLPIRSTSTNKGAL